MIVQKKSIAISMLLTAILLILTGRDALAMKEENGVCKEISLSDIPIAKGDGHWHMPENSMRMTQTYNNLLVPGSDAYCDLGINGTPSWDSPLCEGKKLYYRHTGNDFHREGGPKGVDSAYAITEALLLLSKPYYTTSGWGESMVYAFRLNQFSEEIITVHFHHLHADETTGATSRNYSACAHLEFGADVAKVGDTGKGSTHIHVNIRRFPNISSLIAAVGSSGWGILGKGYANADDTYLPNGKYREPISFLYNEFRDYKPDVNGNLTSYQEEMWPYVRSMLTLGIDTGLYDGRFGEGEELTRKDAARWIKVAAMRSTINPGSQTYADIGPDQEAFPYVETLTRYPDGEETVLNPDANVQDGNRYFYPDQPIGRAPALKMMILAFYADEYQKFYKTFFWLKMANVVMPALAQALNVPESALYDDVDLNDWYAPYVYFGAIKGFVAFGNTSFRPGDPIRREEMAKWSILGRDNIIARNQHECAQKTCQSDEYCDYQTAECTPKAECVTTETQQCEVGGGYDPCSDSPECALGETKTQSCGNGGTQTATCDDACAWGSFGDCIGSGDCTPGQTEVCGNCGTMTCQSNYNYSSCENQGACTPGQTQTQTCNGTGYQTRTCESTCQWGGYDQCSVQQVCSPGETQTQSCTTSQGQPGTQTRTCDSYGQWPSTWSTCTSSCLCSSGTCCDGCNYRSSAYSCDSWTEYRCAGSSLGDDGQYTNVNQYCTGSSTSCSGMTQQSGWSTYANCSSTQTCQMSGGLPVCQDQSCTDVYKQTQSVACYDGNPNGVEICLHAQKLSGSVYKIWLCKDSSFQNSISYELLDFNHPNSNPLYSGTAGSGITCTESVNIDFSYFGGEGTGFGAYLRGDIRSPADTGVLYTSAATLWIYKECQ